MTRAATHRTRPGMGANYWRLFSSSTLANLGDGLMVVAVIWLASSLTRDPTTIALIGLASRLPWLVFSLPAGVLADRYDRRLLVGAMDVLRCLLIAGFTVLLWANQDVLPTPEQLAAGAPPPAAATPLLWALAGLVLLLGFAEVVRDNTAQTLMPAVVDKALLERANSRMWGAEMTMNQFIGPPLSGVLVAVAVAIPFGINAALLGFCAVMVFSLRGSFSSHNGADKRINWRHEIGEGLAWLWRHPLLRALAISLGMMNMASSLSGVVFILFAQEVLGLFEGWKYGLLISGAAVGSVLATLFADRIAARVGGARALVATIIVMGVTLAVTGLVSHAALVWLAQVLSGMAVLVWNVITVSLRQRIIPNHLLGRVNSAFRFFGWGTISIGLLLGGLLVSALEPGLGREWALRSSFLVAGALYVLVLFYAGPRLTQSRLTAAAADAE